MYAQNNYNYKKGEYLRFVLCALAHLFAPLALCVYVLARDAGLGHLLGAALACERTVGGNPPVGSG